MEERPRIKLPLTGTDKLMEVAGVLVLLFAWIYLISSYAGLPATIPIHFNSAGAADGYGDKSMIFLLPAIGTVLYAGLTLLNKYPHIFNYPASITRENAYRQYLVATKMIRLMKLVLAAGFTFSIQETIRVAQGKSEGLGQWFLPIFLALLSIPVVIFMLRSFKREK